MDRKPKGAKKMQEINPLYIQALAVFWMRKIRLYPPFKENALSGIHALEKLFNGWKITGMPLQATAQEIYSYS